MPETFTIVPRGPFSLAEAIGFGFGQRDAAGGDVMRLAFCLDGYQHQAGVEVRQDEAGVHGTVHGPGGTDVDAVRQQVARVLSLDYDEPPGSCRQGSATRCSGRYRRRHPGCARRCSTPRTRPPPGPC